MRPMWFPTIAPEHFAQQMAVYARMRETEAAFRAARPTAEVLLLVPATAVAPEVYWLAVA